MNRYNILIVDDEEGIRQVISMNIQKSHFNIIESSSGNEAYGKCQQQSIDLIITDMMMPDGTGMELLQRVRKEGPNPNVPVIFVTAFSRFAKDQVMNSGANAFFDKPIDYEQLEIEISKYLR